MNKRRLANLVTILVFALAGGMVGLLYKPHWSAVAVFSAGRKDSENPFYTANNNEQHMAFYDPSGKGRMVDGMQAGQAVETIWSAESMALFSLGTYSNDVRSDEKGLPSFVLNNASGALKELFRLDGPNQNPLLILKDNAQNAKLYMGVGLGSVEEEPFLIYFDSAGKHSLFGDLDWHP